MEVSGNNEKLRNSLLRQMLMNPAQLNLNEVFDLPMLVRRASARWGNRIALTFDPQGTRISFNDVERITNQYANALCANGVQPGDRVALMLRNSPQWPLAWLGIVKAGAVMVPLNVYYQSVDASYLLDHAEVSIVICEMEFVTLISQVDKNIRVIAAQEIEQQVCETSHNAPSVKVSAQSLANIQYTSGTTGPPKGCMLSNAWFLRFAQRMAVSPPGLSESDVLLTAQPFYYVDPQWNVALSLLVGAELVILDRFHPSTFWQRIKQHKITWFYCLGVMPKLMLKIPEHPSDRDHSVRFVACSAIPARDHQAIEQRWGVPWYEYFGMTESGLDITVPPEHHDDLVGSGCIGQPMVTREAQIVDNEDKPVPDGQVGNLVLRGPGLLDAYYRNPEATAQLFRNGWLHTGDLARMDDKGLIYYMGRVKDMIRRSGENIAAAEVEDVITQHESVKLAACVPVEDDLRGEEVKVYVVLQPGVTKEDVTPDLLAAFCKQRIAYFKVPRYWTYETDLPRTPSEKIMKSAITDGETDLRNGAYDCVDACWR